MTAAGPASTRSVREAAGEAATRGTRGGLGLNARKREEGESLSFPPAFHLSFGHSVLFPFCSHPQSHARTRDTPSLENVRQGMSPSEARLFLGVKGRLPMRGTELLV